MEYCQRNCFPSGVKSSDIMTWNIRMDELLLLSFSAHKTVLDSQFIK